MRAVVQLLGRARRRGEHALSPRGASKNGKSNQNFNEKSDQTLRFLFMPRTNPCIQHLELIIDTVHYRARQEGFS